MDEELKARLLDSGEIELITTKKIVGTGAEDEGHTLVSLKDFQSLMSRRRERVRAHCATMKKNTPISQKLYVLQSRGLVWCPVYKAASTNWCHNLLHLGGKTQTEVEEIIASNPYQPNLQARVVAPVIAQSSLQALLGQKNATTLIIVRHPFHRVLSAFRDKLEQCHGIPGNCTLQANWYYKQYGSKIVSRYRDEAVRTLGENFFSEGNNYGAPFPPVRSWRDSHYPSWWEFVQHLLHTSPHSYDEHWMPASVYCSVCSDMMEYRNIIKFENIETEESYFAKSIGAGDIIHPRWENKNSNQNISKEDVLAKYFSQLSDTDIQRLYKIYENDFKLFGYSFRIRNMKFNC